MAEEEIRCPRCKSSQLKANKKVFGLGGSGGAVINVPDGLLGRILGYGRVKITCRRCGNVFTAGEALKSNTGVPGYTAIPYSETQGPAGNTSPVVALTKDIFFEEVMRYDDIVVVNFWSDSKNCTSFKPIFDRLAADMSNIVMDDGTKRRIKFCSLFVDDAKMLVLEQGLKIKSNVIVYMSGEKMGQSGIVYTDGENSLSPIDEKASRESVKRLIERTL